MQITDNQFIDKKNVTVRIDSDADLNSEWGKPTDGQDTKGNKTESPLSQLSLVPFMGREDEDLLPDFGDDIVRNLPNSMQEACAKFLTQDEKGTFLVGGLGVISGLLPNLQGIYDGRPVGPNVFVFVVAPFGTGKGGLDYARQLALPVHRTKRNQYEQEKLEYQSAQLRHDSELQVFKKSKAGEPPIPPKRPPNRMLIIPANSSKTAIIQTISENEDCGIIFESEGDTLADAVKQDYGNFSDVLRKAYHHEPIGFLRRGNDGEYIEVARPHLSLVVSSTLEQLVSLIPSAENGLFSRFIFYRLRSNPIFKDVFDWRKSDYTNYFAELGLFYQKLYELLAKRSKDDPIRFALTLDQQAQFLPFFQRIKDETRENIGDDLAGSVNRLGLICFRLCMIFSVLRTYEDTGNVPRFLSCQDHDFDNVLRIVEVLKVHALSIYWHLPKPKIKPSEDLDELKLGQKRLCRELHSKGLSYREIAEQVLGTASKKQTIYRWCNP